MNQDHVSGIPESYFDWHRWQANAANLANKYHEMWKEHYILIEKTLPRQNVLYVRYEDLKDPEKRVHALDKVAKFLGQPADVTKLHCAFVLAENPKAHRATGYVYTIHIYAYAYTRTLYYTHILIYSYSYIYS